MEDVMVLLNPIAYMWYELGEALYIKYDVLQNLKHNNETSNIKLLRIIEQWMMIFSDAYWLELITAVESPLVNDKRIGHEIRKFLETQAKNVSCLNENLKFMLVIVCLLFNTVIICSY